MSSVVCECVLRWLWRAAVVGGVRVLCAGWDVLCVVVASSVCCDVCCVFVSFLVLLRNMMKLGIVFDARYSLLERSSLFSPNGV